MMTLHLCVICGGFEGALGRMASAFHFLVFIWNFMSHVKVQTQAPARGIY